MNMRLDPQGTLGKPYVPNRPLAHKTDHTLACELERRQIHRHSLMNEMMLAALPGENFNSLAKRLRLSTKPRGPGGSSDRAVAAVYRQWLHACRKEQEALEECRARFGDAVRFASAWPAYVAKRARDQRVHS